MFNVHVNDSANTGECHFAMEFIDSKLALLTRFRHMRKTISKWMMKQTKKKRIFCFIILVRCALCSDNIENSMFRQNIHKWNMKYEMHDEILTNSNLKFLFRNFSLSKGKYDSSFFLFPFVHCALCMLMVHGSWHWIKYALTNAISYWFIVYKSTGTTKAVKSRYDFLT